ncbi:flavodoxin domain-containing protein [Candidatus Gottesmanbacteria bacterium]|nr:flavodoxin domain-containing protein [Candidatus Gottesmanbacteria bacterium]
MNILLLIASNSGSTFAASDIVKNALSTAGHTITDKNPKDSTLDDLASAGAVILASPSWDYMDKEGQPHEDFVPFMKSLEGKTLEGKPFAILGLGDINYTRFNGAVDIFEAMVQSLKAKLVVPSLRIDRFYQQQDSTEKVTSWATALAQALPK